jgi:hypothetical protein
VFDIDGANNILQLTNFRRVDTFNPTVSPDGQRVLFTASANPPELGSNPDHNCQMFSIDRNGADLRQLTDFHEVPEGQEAIGCHFSAPGSGCSAFWTSRDIRTDAVMFYSTCDPFGINPYGAQVFAMHADGTGLRQLTNTRGLQTGANDFTVEMPFPFAWPGLELRNQF